MQAIYAGNISTNESYIDLISDIIRQEGVQKLNNYLQHMGTSRLQHSINVSYYSYKIAAFFGADAPGAARAGLLHDMYYYEFKEADYSMRVHSRIHAELALANAENIAALSDTEKDAILSHMWPMTSSAPKHTIGHIVAIADKLCTVFEVCEAMITKGWRLEAKKI